jgi:ring-1,2-phenylacetyl-CoA epoxidase subunit PaaC
MTVEQQHTFQYALQLADTSLVLGHRLSEWCSKAPTLEIDMAFSNMALDLIGQARNFYQHAAALKGNGCDEDQLAYLRDAHEFHNLLLVESENDDFAQAVVRQFFFSAFQLPFFQQLTERCSDPVLGGAAQKAIKELSYHLRWSSEWLIRLGDGTTESKQRTERAIEKLWAFCGEMWTPTPLDQWATLHLNAPAVEQLKDTWFATVTDIFQRANLAVPTQNYFHKGGKMGQHTEKLGYLLAEMQFLQRTYPNATW